MSASTVRPKTSITGICFPCRLGPRSLSRSRAKGTYGSCGNYMKPLRSCFLSVKPWNEINFYVRYYQLNLLFYKLHMHWMYSAIEYCKKLVLILAQGLCETPHCDVGLPVSVMCGVCLGITCIKRGMQAKVAGWLWLTATGPVLYRCQDCLDVCAVISIEIATTNSTAVHHFPRLVLCFSLFFT